MRVVADLPTPCGDDIDPHVNRVVVVVRQRFGGGRRALRFVIGVVVVMMAAGFVAVTGGFVPGRGGARVEVRAEAVPGGFLPAVGMAEQR